jgi:hypothetical protein
MKANKLHLLEIKKKGEASISSSRKALNFIAFLLAILMLLLQVRITTDLLGVLISSLAIFTGFFFTLIVYITDKSVSKIAQITENQKEITPSLSARKFKESYVDFTKKIIAQISYSILLSVFLMIVAFITQVNFFSFDISMYHINVTEIIVLLSTFIFCFTSIRLLYFILVVIGNMQSFFYSEIDQVEDKYK